MSWRAYFQPRVRVMLALGFSSGLPFLLTGATLGYWLRDEGTTLTLIGFISWVGFAYSLKVFWAPVVDRVDAPFLGWLGRRRSWIVLAQIVVALALVGMAVVTPKGGLTTLGAFALLTAIASATQDIVIDAWRIESAATKDELGLLSAAYQLGYRAALLTAEALILIIAQHFGWPVGYVVMAMLMGVGLVATMRAPEPRRALAATAVNVPAPFPKGPAFFDALIGPFTVFFKTHGWVALLMLGMISLYKLPDFVMGPMAAPLYKDLGFSKDAVGSIRASIGLAGTLMGVAAGGFFSQRFGYMKSLIAGGLFQTVGVAGFAVLARSGGDLRVFGGVIAMENFGAAFAGVALITYMSSLTSLGYTATQYALLSSTYAYLGKFLKGFSGVIVDHLALSRSLFDAYAIFFLGAGAIGLPAVVLCVVLMRVQAKRHTMTHA
jgi:MFS transporter, PAT family, beta-lactamase induction signal transducer AmpG